MLRIGCPIRLREADPRERAERKFNISTVGGFVSPTYVKAPPKWRDTGSNHRILINGDDFVVHKDGQGLISSFGQLREM